MIVSNIKWKCMLCVSVSFATHENSRHTHSSNMYSTCNRNCLFSLKRYKLLDNRKRIILVKHSKQRLRKPKTLSVEVFHFTTLKPSNSFFSLEKIRVCVPYWPTALQLINWTIMSTLCFNFNLKDCYALVHAVSKRRSC